MSKAWGKWGKKTKDPGEMKRTETYPIEYKESKMAKACPHGDKVPCPPDCPNFKKSIFEEMGLVKAESAAHKKRMLDIAEKLEDEYENEGDDAEKSMTQRATALLRRVQPVAVAKALSTRNFAMPRLPAMMARYNAQQTFRSAMTQTSRRHSALAPLVKDTMDHVGSTEVQRTHPEPLERSMCHAHDLTYKSDSGCPACRVAKSLETPRPDSRYHLR